jgi:hypothetical protein
MNHSGWIALTDETGLHAGFSMARTCRADQTGMQQESRIAALDLDVTHAFPFGNTSVDPVTSDASP